MHETLDPVAADEVYAAALEPRPVADDAPGWLAMVLDDLATLDPQEFREAWGLD